MSKNIRSYTISNVCKVLFDEYLPVLPGNVIMRMWREGMAVAPVIKVQADLDKGFVNEMVNDFPRKIVSYTSRLYIVPTSPLWTVLAHSLRICDIIRRISMSLRFTSSTSEYARLSGIPFNTVHARGSQFR
jgi:hypothetical protein